MVAGPAQSWFEVSGHFSICATAQNGFPAMASALRRVRLSKGLIVGQVPRLAKGVPDCGQDHENVQIAHAGNVTC